MIMISFFLAILLILKLDKMNLFCISPFFTFDDLLRLGELVVLSFFSFLAAERSIISMNNLLSPLQRRLGPLLELSFARCSLITKFRDATHHSGKIRKFGKYQNVANKCIKWSIMV